MQGAEGDHIGKAGEYLAAAVLRHAAPSETAETAARSVISAVQSGTAEPQVFCVGDLALNGEGEVVGHLSNNGLAVVDFDGVSICCVEKVAHKDGQVLTHAGVAVPEEFISQAVESIVKAAVVRTCVADDEVVGYMSSQKRVVDDSGSAVGTFDGTHVVRGGQQKTLEAQPGEVVSLQDISDAAFQGAAQAGVNLTSCKHQVLHARMSDWRCVLYFCSSCTGQCKQTTLCT